MATALLENNNKDFIGIIQLNYNADPDDAVDRDFLRTFAGYCQQYWDHPDIGRERFKVILRRKGIIKPLNYQFLIRYWCREVY
jgi:hypothetical protein